MATTGSDDFGDYFDMNDADEIEAKHIAASIVLRFDPKCVGELIDGEQSKRTKPTVSSDIRFLQACLHRNNPQLVKTDVEHLPHKVLSDIPCAVFTTVKKPNRSQYEPSTLGLFVN